MSRLICISTLVDAPFTTQSIEKILSRSHMVGCSYFDYENYEGYSQKMSLTKALGLIDNMIASRVTNDPESEEIIYIGAEYEQKVFSLIFDKNEQFIEVTMLLPARTWTDETDPQEYHIAFNTALSFLLKITADFPLLHVETTDEYASSDLYHNGRVPSIPSQVTTKPTPTGKYLTNIILSGSRTPEVVQGIIDTLVVTQDAIQFYTHNTDRKEYFEISQVASLLIHGEMVCFITHNTSSYTLSVQPYLKNIYTLITLQSDPSQNNSSLRSTVETALAIIRNCRLLELDAHDTRYVNRRLTDDEEAAL